MSGTDDGCADEDCTCLLGDSLLVDAIWGAYYAAMPAAVGAAVCALFWDVGWTPFWVAAGVIIGVQLGMRSHLWSLQIKGMRLRREVDRRSAEIRALQQEIAFREEQTHRARIERIQLEALNSQLKAQEIQLEAYYSALRAENLQMERLLVQRKVEQAAREARQRLDVACAAIEADRLEAAAWRMEFTAKQLEVKLNQADLFESLSAIEDNAQDRILAAYKQGVDHGMRGIVIPYKNLRHLRVVEESA